MYYQNCSDLFCAHETALQMLETNRNQRRGLAVQIHHQAHCSLQVVVEDTFDRDGGTIYTSMFPVVWKRTPRFSSPTYYSISRAGVGKLFSLRATRRQATTFDKNRIRQKIKTCFHRTIKRTVDTVQSIKSPWMSKKTMRIGLTGGTSDCLGTTD